MTRLPVFNLAAHARAWGIPTERLLTAREPAEVLFEMRLTERAIERRVEDEEAIASQIGSAVAKALS